MVRRLFIVLGIMVASIVAIIYCNHLGVWVSNSPPKVFNSGDWTDGVNTLIEYVAHSVNGMLVCAVCLVLCLCAFYACKYLIKGIVMLVRFVGEYIKFGVSKR